MVLPSEERKCGDLLSLHAIESSADTGHPSLAIPPADNPWENPGSLEETVPSKFWSHSLDSGAAAVRLTVSA